jgi:hypothetical protein
MSKVIKLKTKKDSAKEELLAAMQALIDDEHENAIVIGFKDDEIRLYASTMSVSDMLGKLEYAKYMVLSTMHWEE